jgi:integrase
MMGEDNQIYSQDEEVSSVSLFEKYEKISQEKDEELAYLEVLRTYKKTFPKSFETLRTLSTPLSMRKNHSHKKAYIALEINKELKYISVEEEKNIQMLSFVEIAKVFSALSDEKASLLSHDKAHDYEAEAIQYFEKAFRKEKADKAEKRIDVKSEQTATSYLKEWLKKGFLSQEAFRDYKKAIQKGTLSFLSIKELNRLYKQKDEEIKEKLLLIIDEKRDIQEKLFEENLDIKVLLSAVFTKDNR